MDKPFCLEQFSKLLIFYIRIKQVFKNINFTINLANGDNLIDWNKKAFNNWIYSRICFVGLNC